MRKRDELTNPDSCMSHAFPEEYTFVLLGRDITAPLVIWFWCILRVLFRKNRWCDSQLTDARWTALHMKEEREEIRKRKHENQNNGTA